jgi:hypothetical protein
MRLKDMYREISERPGGGQSKLEKEYPGVIDPRAGPPPPHAPRLLLMIKCPPTLSERAMESLFSPYGLFERYPGPREASWYLRFEDDEQAADVLRAGRRLNIAGVEIECYRIKQDAVSESSPDM